MKIGIMTFWYSNENYGQQLQCFALQKYLRDAGHDAYLIRYDKWNDYDEIHKVSSNTKAKPIWKKLHKALNPILLYKYLQQKRKSTILAKEQKNNNKREFEKFRDKYIKKSKIYCFYDELKENPPEADAYIAGSDQVWNPDLLFYSKKSTAAYFLDFGCSQTKKMAYAASFGRSFTDNDNEFITKITPLLKKFNYISVREKTGLTFCEQCGINNADWVPDPTMLLKADDYRALYKNESFKKPKKPYCLFYFLGNECDFPVKSVYKWAKIKKLEVIYISANNQNDKYKKNYATIPEWIYLVEHAEFIITNSYHCCVFSLIFQKKFGVVSLAKKFAGMNDRLDSLFELLQIEERYLNTDFSVLEKRIDWQSVSKIFEKLRNECKLLNYL